MIRNTRWILVLGLALTGCGGTMGGSGSGTSDGGGVSDGGAGSRTCGAGCTPGFVCQQGQCALDPVARWILTVESARLTERKPDGSSWDVPGGLPDPYVCITVNGARGCTSARADTTTPRWNEAFGPFTSTALQSGVAVEIWDEDLTDDDPVCGRGTLSVSAANFRSGSLGAECTSATLAMTLSPG